MKCRRNYLAEAEMKMIEKEKEKKKELVLRRYSRVNSLTQNSFSSERERSFFLFFFFSFLNPRRKSTGFKASVLSGRIDNAIEEDTLNNGGMIDQMRKV